MLEQNNNGSKKLLPSIEYLKQSFNQDTLMSKAWILDVRMLQGKISVGLCIDYARHIINHRNSKILPDYIKDLNRKTIQASKNLKKFINKIEDYQSLQPDNYQKTQSNLKLALQNKRLIESLKSGLQLTSLIYLSLSDQKEGHVIVLHLVRNDYQEIISYKIFDPNIGMYQVDEVKKCNEIIINLSKYYGYNKCEAFNLEKFIIEKELAKGTKQYLSTNPNAIEFLSMKFYYYCGINKIEAIKQLLTDARVDVNKPTKDGWTPLNSICDEGKIEAIKLLLTDARIDVNKPNNNGFTPLNSACGKGKTEVVKLLLIDARVDINKPNNYGCTPLHSACGEGKTEIVKLLLTDARVDVNKTDDNGWTPLNFACYNGKIEVIKLLLTDARVDVNKPNNNGWTPLHSACYNSKTKAIELLLSDARIDVNKTDDNGWTPLNSACYNRKTKVVKLLLTDERVDNNKPNNNGWTPLNSAYYQKNKEIVLLFINKGVDINLIYNNLEKIIPSMEYLKQSFNQEILTSKSWILDINTLQRQQGLCVGFCIDYARHIINYRNSKVSPDYIKGLNRKNIQADKNLKKFINRIEDYQSLQPTNYQKTQINLGSALQNKKLIESLDFDLKSTSLVYLSLSNDNVGHSIVLHLVRNDYQEITSYKIFDPNIGMYQVDKVEKCNEIIINLSKHYGYDQCEAFNLEKFIIEKELTKGAKKYLNTNPNAAEFLSMKFRYYCMEGNTRLIKLLLTDARVDVNKSNNHGVTSLHYACSKNKTEVVKLLLSDTRIDVNKTDDDGWTPLYFACYKGKIGTIKLLLADARIDVNKTDNNARTPLYYALSNKDISIKILKQLFNQSERINARDNKSNTRLMSYIDG